VGRKCQRPSQHGVWGGQPHAVRDQAAMDVGLLRKCQGEKVKQSVVKCNKVPHDAMKYNTVKVVQQTLF
jgi:hypothetical protein